MSVKLKDMLEALCDLCHEELNEWEAKFVDDTTKRVEKGGTLTVHQFEKVVELYRRECR